MHKHILGPGVWRVACAGLISASHQRGPEPHCAGLSQREAHFFVAADPLGACCVPCRHFPGPWAEFQGHNFVLTVRKADAALEEDAQALVEWYDEVVDAQVGGRAGLVQLHAMAAA